VPAQDLAGGTALAPRWGDAAQRVGRHCTERNVQKERTAGGCGAETEGETMASIERAIEIEVPASTAYNTWTRFELFPEFMDGVESVRQKDERHLSWRARIGGKTEEWDAEITEQIPDKRIAWRAQGGAANAGVVTFHRLSDEGSRVMLQMTYEPERLSEKVGDALGFVRRRIDGDLQRFKRFVEKRGDPVEGWRGEVRAKPDAAQREER
jgi:uncharacterized membrane protein